MLRYLLAIAVGVDVLVNALTGGAPYTTISYRIGVSIQAGGWAAHVPWPAFLRAHFLSAITRNIV